MKNVITVLKKIIHLLEESDERVWSSILLTRKMKLIQAIDSSSNKWILAELEEIIALYGGMGSFTDLFLINETGHSIAPQKIVEKNRSLDRLRSELYDSTIREISTLRLHD